MTDLLERLRNKNWLWTVPGALREEAADEIDRLTAENEQLMEQIAFHQPSVVERDMQLVMAINNRLRAALEDALLVLEVQFGKKAEPGSLIYQIRKTLANEQDK